MAGRFSKLDFDARAAASPAAAPADDPWPNMDEDGCLKLGDARFQVGSYEDALTSYSRALRFNQGLAAAWVGQIRCLLCLGEFPEAVTWSDRALERFGEQSDLLACKGLALLESGEMSSGMEYLDGAVERRAPTPWVWLARGTGLLLAKLPDVNASRCFLKAVELAPSDWHLEMRVGMAYNRFRLFARARPPLLSALRHAGENPLLLTQAALMHEGLGEFSLASGLFARAAAARPGDLDSQNGLARTSNVGPLTKLWRKVRGN